MNQIVGFKDFLIDQILNGVKYYTTRPETQFRLKLDVGDTMYIFSGNRTAKMKKHGEAIVKNRWRWNQSTIRSAYFFMNQFDLKIENYLSPIGVKWSEFAKGEGFRSILELLQWFNQKKYLSQPLITYQFELLKEKVI